MQMGYLIHTHSVFPSALFRVTVPLFDLQAAAPVERKFANAQEFSVPTAVEDYQSAQ